MAEISFQNTETAFRHKTVRELRRARQLFSLISNPGLVAFGNALTGFALSIGMPIKGIIKATLFKQFVGGENIQECDRTIQSLNSSGIGTILDYSVEGKTTEEGFEAGTEEIIKTIEKAKGNPAIPFSVFKVSGLGSLSLLEAVSSGKPLSEEHSQAFELLKSRVERICESAYKSDVPVFIDAEESWIQQAIDDLCEQMMQKYNGQKAIVFNTVQMYRHDRLGYLKQLHQKSIADSFYLGLKIVRGAYMEKERARAIELNYPDPIQPDKSSSDRDYNEALRYCIAHIDRISICAGSHNEDSCMLLVKEMEKNGIDNRDKRIWFAQLLGMSDHISYNLSAAGYNVAKYVPYGPVKELLPYLSRRAQENTSVKGQTGRELALITQELQRRKQTAA